MNKYKVCVYAISKDEEKFVDRWVDSMEEADAIYVLDTGSKDKTVEKLKQRGVNVETCVIKPWRFDKARNISLDMVPMDTDICVCTDLDETFENGWRKKLEKRWDKDTSKVKYNYNWSFDKYGKPATTFYIEKIHKRKGYYWHHPVHEVLNILDNEKSVLAPEIILNHHPDPTKSRSSYLPLLELSVKESPLDDRNMHYLGREYMYYGKYNEAIDTLIKHINLPTATWDAEKCASMRFIARCYISLGRVKEAEMWLVEAIKEASYLREGYVELAGLFLNLERYEEANDLLNKAFLIKEKAPIYINEAFAWNDYIYDLKGIITFNLKLYPESLECFKKALELNPESTRIANNYKIVYDYLNPNS